MSPSSDEIGHSSTPDRSSGIDAASIHDLVDLDPPTLRRTDVAALSGVPNEQTVRWWRAMGFPEVGDEERIFGAQDVEMARELASMIATGEVGNEDVLRIARLMGASFSRLANAQLELLDDLLAAMPDADPGDDRRARFAKLIARGDANILEFLERAMVYVWRRHFLAALGAWLSVDQDASEQAVGFADISGFSRLARKVSSMELANIIEAFENAAFDAVSVYDGRIVKSLGDEVMFVTPSVENGVNISLDVMVALEARPDVPPIHCGLAYGPTVSVGGDVFGPIVNLASRLTKIARPNTIALPRDVAAPLLDREDLVVRRVRRSYDLKGVGRTSIVVVRASPDYRSVNN